jgi:hypothetical protein
VANSYFSVADSISGITGSTVSVTCADGYVGGGTWTCRSDGSFSGIKCEASTTVSASLEVAGALDPDAFTASLLSKLGGTVSAADIEITSYLMDIATSASGIGCPADGFGADAQAQFIAGVKIATGINTSTITSTTFPCARRRAQVRAATTRDP